MASKNVIVLTADPKGNFSEGTIVGTPKPGTLMEVVPNTALTNGRPSYRAASLPNGQSRMICVLREDDLQGFTVGTPYVTGTRGFLYWPLPGDEINVFVDVPGTGGGTIYPIGQLYEADSAGFVSAISGTVSCAFVGMEAVVDSSLVGGSPILTWCMRS